MCKSKGQVFVREQGLEYASNLREVGKKSTSITYVTMNYELAIKIQLISISLFSHQNEIIAFKLCNVFDINVSVQHGS